MSKFGLGLNCEHSFEKKHFISLYYDRTELQDTHLRPLIFDRVETTIQFGTIVSLCNLSVSD